MSQENVEAVRGWSEAWNRSDLDQMLSLLDSKVEWRTSGSFPGLDPVYTGHDGFTRFWREFVEPWESFQIRTDDVRDCGDRVLSLGDFEAQGRDGLEVRRPTASVYRSTPIRPKPSKPWGCRSSALTPHRPRPTRPPRATAPHARTGSGSLTA